MFLRENMLRGKRQSHFATCVTKRYVLNKELVTTYAVWERWGTKKKKKKKTVQQGTCGYTTEDVTIAHSCTA